MQQLLVSGKQTHEARVRTYRWTSIFEDRAHLSFGMKPDTLHCAADWTCMASPGSNAADSIPITLAYSSRSPYSECIGDSLFRDGLKSAVLLHAARVHNPAFHSAGR